MRSSRTLAIAVLVLLATAAPALAGNARFGSPVSFAVPHPTSLAVADFDRDGHRDFAAVDYVDGYVAVRLTGKAAPAPVDVGSSPNTVVTGDFNRDAVPDLAVANFDDNTVSVRLGDGSGKFANAPDVAVALHPYALVVGDFNADGRDDLAIADDSSAAPTGHVSVRLGLGDGTFTAGGSVDVVHPYTLVVGDFDNDTNEDLAFGASGDKAGVIDGAGGGALVRGADIKLPSAAVRQRGWAVGDFDEDQNEDLAALVPDAGVVAIRLGFGDGKFYAVKNVPVGENAWAVAVGDFNSDGHEDLAVADAGNKVVKLRLGDGVGGFKPAPAVPTVSTGIALAVADFNADGNDDLAVAGDEANGSVGIHPGLGRPALAGNLLVNGGFEATPGQAASVPGWKTTGDPLVVAYGSPSHAYVPSALDSPRYGTGGGRLLTGGESTNGVTTTSQTVDVAGRQAAIDAGRARVELSAYLGGALAFTDRMDVRADFLRAGGATIRSLAIGPVTVSDRLQLTTLLRRFAATQLPAGTRRIRVTLKSIDADKVSSAEADNVKLTLDTRRAFAADARVDFAQAKPFSAPSDPAVVGVLNRNPFTVTGSVSARTVKRLGAGNKPLELGSRSLKVRASAAQRLKFVLPQKARQELVAAGGLDLRVRAVVHDAAGNSRTLVRIVRLAYGK